jgi:HD-GYP domain-containing protein (c-di-GMP phosphodiesterase class II)
MTQERPYQPAMPPAEAIAELRRCKGARFDPDVVEAICGEIEAGRIPPPAERMAMERSPVVSQTVS